MFKLPKRLLNNFLVSVIEIWSFFDYWHLVIGY